VAVDPYLAARGARGLSATQWDRGMSDSRKKILVFIDWYLPGFKGGGPITSIANMVEALGGTYHFSIVTSDKDYGQKLPYEGIETDTWVEHNAHCRVWYCTRETSSYRHVRRIIAETNYDMLYLNSMFSLRYTIFPLWNSRSTKPEAPVLLAPRGMLHAGALGLKPLKKKLFLGALRLTGIYKQLTFQATDEQEILDIKGVFGPDSKVLKAPNLPKVVQPPLQLLEKKPGQLRMVFLSRLTEKKGLHFLLEFLQNQTAEINLDIIGPDEEAGYWARCKLLIALLPPNVKVEQHPPLPPEEAMAHLRAAHCFVMPTLGENFGHAIFEALSAGRPVLISDQTPWRDLAARRLGFDIPLKHQQGYLDAIAQLVGMGQDEWAQWAQASWAFAAEFIANGGFVADNKALLEQVMAEDKSQADKH
jgi:glycosyltransferase involved in cell wall biosynthesis